MKPLVANDYGGFYFPNEAKEYLLQKGYSPHDAFNICSGFCPRDLPVLFELFKLFGRYTDMEIQEYPDEPYRVVDCNEGIECVVLESQLYKPGAGLYDNEKGGAE